LDAAAFVPLVDVDPRVGEHLLDVLGSAGVPAYLEPSVDVEPYTRALSLPSPPTDRLWVDRDQRPRARQIVEAETPHGTRPRPTPRDDEPSHGLADRDEERAWQQIVAGWNVSAPEDPVPRPDSGLQDPGQQPPGPDAGPVDPEPDPGDRPRHGPIDRIGPDGHRHSDGPRTSHAGRTGTHPWDDTDLFAEPDPDRRRRRRRADTGQVTGADLDAAAEARAAQEADAAEAADEVWITGPPTLDGGTEEHFEPPPPPPVPRPSRHAIFAVLLVVLGIVFLAAPDVLGLDDRSGLTLGVLAILAGGALLVLRLRETRADDGPDDGAIV
jgi:hypothetical protein